MKRKRAYNALYSGANPDGNYTPSDSDNDSDDEDLRPVQRKIVKNQSNQQSRDDERPNNADDRNRASNSRDVHGPGNSQLLYSALRKIQELENELAEIDDADYDSGHHDEDEIDEGNASDIDDNIPPPMAINHNHLNDIVNADAEALGFAFCVKETFDYLASEGVTEDNPIVKALRERFLDRCDSLPLN